MTLKEKFINTLHNWIEKDYNREHVAKLLEIDSDDYAIEFAEWLRYNCVESDYGWQNYGKYYSDKEIVKLFKEEKGL